MDDTAARIYRAYRLALQSQWGGRAGQRKQAARALVTARYKLTHRELKDLVAQGDKEAGVSHEPPAPYARYLGFLEWQEATDARRAGEPCTCGQVGEDVFTRSDPLKWKEGLFEVYYSCQKCYLLRALEAPAQNPPRF